MRYDLAVSAVCGTIGLTTVSTHAMPFYRFAIDSSLDKPTALKQLRTLVREPRSFGQSMKETFGWRPEGTAPFFGEINDDEFDLRRDIGYRNSFLPSIHGRVTPRAQGSRIAVSMHLHLFTAMFMAVWLTIVAAGAIAVSSAGKLPLIPAGMFVFGVTLCVGAFYPEAFKARRMLEEALSSSARSADISR